MEWIPYHRAAVDNQEPKSLPRAYQSLPISLSKARSSLPEPRGLPTRLLTLLPVKVDELSVLTLSSALPQEGRALRFAILHDSPNHDIFGVAQRVECTAS